ncbi:hypothetical protein ABFX02_06G053400 [Erythranthe guttata]
MTVFPDSRTPQKMQGKKLFEDNNSSIKRRKLDCVRQFPVNCGAPVGEMPSSNYTKCPEVGVVSYVTKSSSSSPFDSGVDGDENKPPGFQVDNDDSRQIGKKIPLLIPGLPFRSGPKDSVRDEPHCVNDVVVGRKTVFAFEESWKRDSEKLAAVIAKAKEFISKFDPTSKCSSIGAAISNKRARDEICDEFLAPQDSDRSLREKRIGVEENNSREDEEEVCVLSHAEWSGLQFGSENCSNTSKVKIESNQEVVSDTQPIEAKCGENDEDLICTDSMDECASHGEEEEDESSEMFCVDDHNSLVLYSDISSKEVFIGGNNSEARYDESQELVNMSIVKHNQPHGIKVSEALSIFELQYTELLRAETRGETKVVNPHLEAARILKEKGVWIEVEKHFGHIPGVEIGDEFRFRVELAVVGLHQQLISGIDYVFQDGKKFATSVVNSGRYENEAKALDVLIYSGHGGNLNIADNAVDQKLEKGNLALVNSMEAGYPIRVTYKKKCTRDHERNYVYVYDGLYTVNRYWQERDQKGKLVFKFELQRMAGQPRPYRSTNKSRKSKMFTEVCVLDDVSRGREKMPIRAMNGVDTERPPLFTYETVIEYPNWYRLTNPVGCDCIDGCSDSEPCSCVLKNGGEIPFNENGDIIRAKPRVHECGPLCKCPPSCMNRVSQNGLRYKLEIFKTKSRGWGVRSRSYISSGSFICEYVGKLLRDKEAETRVDRDEYLFDISESEKGVVVEGRGERLIRNRKRSVDGYAIDAAMHGNVGRFINHSCSPNLYAQEILYDHDDKRMPHIMFFASKNIPPMQELTYDYNYKLDRICDVNGNIKTKACYCGARNCTGRMY